MIPSGIKEPGRYPLPELAHITVSKPTDQLTPFEHLFIGALLEEFKRIKRQSN